MYFVGSDISISRSYKQWRVRPKGLNPWQINKKYNFRIGSQDQITANSYNEKIGFYTQVWGMRPIPQEHNEYQATGPGPCLTTSENPLKEEKTAVL